MAQIHGSGPAGQVLDVCAAGTRALIWGEFNPERFAMDADNVEFTLNFRAGQSTPCSW
jgi:hypothetical protein